MGPRISCYNQNGRRANQGEVKQEESSERKAIPILTAFSDSDRVYLEMNVPYFKVRPEPKGHGDPQPSARASNTKPEKEGPREPNSPTPAADEI